MFKHLLCNDVEIQIITEHDSYDNPIIEDERVIKGKLEYQIKKVTNRNGDEVVSTGQLRCIEPMDLYYRIKVNNVWRDIINILPQDDFSGKVQYFVVYF